MLTSTRIYILSALVLLIATVPFNVILFFATLLASAFFGLFFYLDRQLPEIERDYEVFKENRPIHFIERDAHFWNYMSNAIERRPNLVQKVDYNKRFTNDSSVDGQLNELLQLVFQDFVHPWHQSISLSQEFPHRLYLFINYTISAFARKLKEINVSNLLSSKLLDELIKHNRLYRLTKNRLTGRVEHSDDDFVSVFFENERKLERTFSREKLCLDQSQLTHFIDQLTDVLQYILFPYHSFNNETFRLFTKGIFVKTVMLPLFDLFTEPDFINGIIITACKAHLPTTDTLLAVLQSVDDMNELRAVLESVETEIQFVRSKDDNDSEMKMKQQLGSLLYLKKIILAHLKKFEDLEEEKVRADSLNDDVSQADSPITFEAVLRNSVALEYFTEYMSSINASSYINFFINVEAFKISVEQGLFEIYLSSFGDGASEEQCRQLRQLVLEAALNIYETYLSPIAPNRLELIEQRHCDKLRDQLSSNDSSALMSEGLFDEIFDQVRSVILKHEPFFPAFKRNKHYLKLFQETDLLKELHEHPSTAVAETIATSKPADDDLSEIDSIDSHLGEGVKDLKSFDGKVDSTEGNGGVGERKDDDKTDFSAGFTADIIETGMLNEHGKSFVAYLINVTKPNGDKWVILRRYSEFHTFHHMMLEKCEKFHCNLKTILILPPKTVLSNRTSRHFIQYRKYMLSIYLKKLSYLYDRFNFLHDDIETFLHPGHYNSKPRLERNGSRNGRFNPIKSIGNAMKNGSENLLDGFQKLSRTLSLQHETKVPEKKVHNQSNSLQTKYVPLLSGGTQQRSPEETHSGGHNASNGGKHQPQPLPDNNDDGVSLDSFESDENIPLLSLLDEIFDLKNQNFWFRRRLIDLFKQIIEATYSDMINKKIADYIDLWTSPASIAEYIGAFKHSFWPNGRLVESTPCKNDDLLRRRIAAKALILTSLNDLKKVVGGETMQNGVLSFYELFQNKTLNQRLILVLFELLLKEIFPNNYFEEIFARLYAAFDSKSNRSTASSSSADWPPHLSKFIARI